MAGIVSQRVPSLLVVSLGLLALPCLLLALDCSVPEYLYEGEPTLPKTLGALKSGQSVSIVALGGASTLGQAAGGPSQAWPARLAVALGSRFPAAHVQVVNRAIVRQTAVEMVARMDHDVIALHPTLVIWETGTADAVSGMELDTFRQAIQAGIDQLRASGAEVILMDMQFARQTETIINFDEYDSILREVTDASNVPLFRRHDIMRHWLEGNLFDLPPGDQEALRRMAAHLYDCIGQAVAQLIIRDSELGTSHTSTPAGSAQ